MLRLIQLIVCEKIIIDAEGGSVSAIGMFETLTATLSKDAPEKILFPMRWSVVGLWRRDSNFEKPAHFTQKIIVKSPENEEAFIVESDFEAKNENYNFRNVVNFVGFPVSTTGVVNIEIYLKQQDQDEWIKHFSYPVNIIRTVEDKPNASETNAENTGVVKNPNNSNQSV